MLIGLTGASGFLGRYLVRRLAGKGHRLRCWFRPGSDRSGLEAIATAIEWVPGRLGDAAANQVLVGGADAVVHAAVDWKRIGVSRSKDLGDLEDFLQANLMGSLQLMQTAYTSGVPRFIFISTCAVHEAILDDRVLDEAHPLWPMSPYGAHKAALEKFAHSYGLGLSWPICALRPTGIYGVSHPPSASRWLDLVGQVLAGAPIATAAGGKEVHASDVARAVEMLLNAEAGAVKGQAFNCYDMYIAEQDVARIAKELSGSRSRIAELNRGPKHQIDTKKIRALGMTFGGQDLLRRTVEELIGVVAKK